MTLRQAYREGTAVLESAGITEAPLDAWLLLSHVTGLSRAAYYGDPDRPLTEGEEDRYHASVMRRSGREPLQHITGEQGFMGYTFRVDARVLIPRQDTETLAEEALKRLKKGMRVLDMCTGSGCILISLLKRGPAFTGTGADLSQEALEVARENAERLGVRADFIRSDLFERVEGRYDMIVSNPPYIPTEEIEKLQEEVRLYDPRMALDGKEDGLFFYRRIIKDSVDHISPGGSLLFEIGCGQGDAVSRLLREAGYSGIQVQKDLAGLDRVVAGIYTEERKHM